MFGLLKNTPKLLHLVEYADPILRQETKKVDFPLSAEDKQIIADMKYSIKDRQLKKANAPFESAAGMAANQWGIDKKIFLFAPKRGILEVIINPNYEPIHEEGEHSPMLKGWEGCFSIPLGMNHVQRYAAIKAKYQNEEGVFLEKILTGWIARIWQHETDHLNGLLSDNPLAGCLEKRVFNSRKELEAFERSAD